MPPKKKQKNSNNGRNNQNFDDSRFLSEDSERRYYDIFTRRSIRVERNVVLEDFCETRIAGWFQTLGWTSILSARGEAIVEWVREFYSNMRDVDNNAMCFKTWVRFELPKKLQLGDTVDWIPGKKRIRMKDLPRLIRSSEQQIQMTSF